MSAAYLLPLIVGFWILFALAAGVRHAQDPHQRAALMILLVICLALYLIGLKGFWDFMTS